MLGELARETKDREHDEFGYDIPQRTMGSQAQNHILLQKVSSPSHPLPLTSLSLNVHHHFHHSGLTSQLLVSF